RWCQRAVAECSVINCELKMDKSEIQLIGGPCGQHGPYTFYKAFKYTKNGVKRIVTLSEFFFVKLWIDSDLLCIGELQLLWNDKNSDQVLASLRLYFLPENTPEGRMDHGEDEVLAISEKVVIRVEDLITWITVDAEWTWGRLAKCQADVKSPSIDVSAETPVPVPLAESSLDFSDVEKERKLFETTDNSGPSVIILSYPKYARYRAMMKRLESVEDDYLKMKLVVALGGFSAISRDTRVLFCRDTFDYPELEGHELLCNHLAPKMKGRPRGKRKKRSVSPGSESNESESSVSHIYIKQKITTEGGRNGLRCDSTTSRRCTRSAESRQFIKKLNSFMKSNQTPMGRIPCVGAKELDLHEFYLKVQKLGGYDAVTSSRLWKSLFEEISGNMNSTSAATIIRRHYERFLLAFERNVKGEEYKPLPVYERRRLKSKAGSSSLSDNETSESPSNSGSSTPVPSCSGIAVAGTSKDYKDCVPSKPEVKTSSLRSVRVKTERQKEKQCDNNAKHQNNNNYSCDAETVVNPEADKTENQIEIKDEVVKLAEDSTDRVESPPQVAEECDVIKAEVVKVEAVISVEPDTSAVAPIVQKISPLVTLSPTEEKDEPFIKTGDTGSNVDVDVVEVPFKPKTPEIVDLESDAFKAMNSSINKTFVQEVKKRKLDILKEGGLEVTPVRSGSMISKRPSVIQPTITTVTVPIKNLANNDGMPPPLVNIVPSKRSSPQTTQTKSGQKSPLPSSPSKAFSFGNSLPPRVVQSRSIYSYSEKTVYGNPKDVYAPKFPELSSRQCGGDLLDLTITSPQKPVADVVRVPQIPSSSSSLYNRLSDNRPMPQQHQQPRTASLIEGRRLGSNLEITLVGPNSAVKPPPQNKYPAPAASVQITPNHNRHHAQKRMPSEMYLNSKVAKTDLKMKHPKPSSQVSPKAGADINIPNPYVNKSPSIKADPINSYMKAMQTASKPYPSTPASAFPGYLSQIYEQSNQFKNLYQYAMDSQYANAMQGLYAGYPVNQQQMVMPSPEQLKLYADWMSTQMHFSYAQNDASHINNMKKQ
ncbi:unnamed protein product, partial [Brassicogethes aeneus]